MAATTSTESGEYTRRFSQNVYTREEMERYAASERQILANPQGRLEADDHDYIVCYGTPDRGNSSWVEPIRPTWYGR